MLSVEFLITLQSYDEFSDNRLSFRTRKCSFCSICAKTELNITGNDYLCKQKGQNMNKQPQLMDLSRMRDILTPHLSQISESIFFNSELGIVRGDP